MLVTMAIGVALVMYFGYYDYVYCHGNVFWLLWLSVLPWLCVLTISTYVTLVHNRSGLALVINVIAVYPSSA